MYFGKAKVYYDGSHYIAIPHSEKRTQKRRLRKNEEEITVVNQGEDEEGSTPEKVEEPSASFDSKNAKIEFEEVKNIEILPFQDDIVEKQQVKMSKKDLFDKLYQENINLTIKERKLKITEQMMSYFESERDCNLFVQINFERKRSNIIKRRTRMSRKANLIDFNYFCTFTYNSELHTEASFRKMLRKSLMNLSVRKGWRYIGVWERSPQKQRLHFHGIFYIPDGTMPGALLEYKDFNLAEHKMQTTCQNTYFNEHFGRSDFSKIDDDKNIGSSLAYIMKYIEKTGEKIVYSRGLYQYFISDILDDDIICNYGLEDKKLLLFDDFKCLDEGVLIGTVCKQVIAQMRKSN